MSKELIIKAVKCYQAVEFETKLETFFAEAQNRMVGLKFSIWNNVGIKMETPKCSIIVPFANIAYIKDVSTEGRELKVGEQVPNRNRSI